MYLQGIVPDISNTTITSERRYAQCNSILTDYSSVHFRPVFFFGNPTFKKNKSTATAAVMISTMPTMAPVLMGSPPAFGSPSGGGVVVGSGVPGPEEVPGTDEEDKMDEFEGVVRRVDVSRVVIVGFVSVSVVVSVSVTVLVMMLVIVMTVEAVGWDPG